MRTLSQIAHLCFLLMVGAAFSASSLASDIHDPIYHLQAGDVLDISVWKEDGLSREIVIAPDGNFSFPLIGQIRAEGLSVEELRNVIIRRIVSFIPEASVAVVLKAAMGNKYYVIGKVNRPGQYAMDTPVTVLQALSVAGGTTTFADYSKIKVIRQAEGSQVAIDFDYREMERGKALEQNLQLRSGDVVLVP